MSQKVAVLGATGMLGRMVLDVLSRESDIELTATVRSLAMMIILRNKYPHVNWIVYNAELDDAKTVRLTREHQWIVNCIGITKPLIHEDNPTEVARAIRVNALWPHQLGASVGWEKSRLLQIATDCVFSGQNGPYAEASTPDAHNTYGRTKALGEVTYPGCTNLRTSIIGPEFTRQTKFLLAWVLKQPQDAVLEGYVDHYWNGITTLQFAKICLGIIRTRPEAGSLVHVVPRNTVTKFELLQAIASAYGRTDLLILPKTTPHANMTLSTHLPHVVRGLWAAAGYHEAPTIEQMVQEVAAYQHT